MDFFGWNEWKLVSRVVWWSAEPNEAKKRHQSISYNLANFLEHFIEMKKVRERSFRFYFLIRLKLSFLSIFLMRMLFDLWFIKVFWTINHRKKFLILFTSCEKEKSSSNRFHANDRKFLGFEKRLSEVEGNWELIRLNSRPGTLLVERFKSFWGSSRYTSSLNALQRLLHSTS